MKKTVCTLLIGFLAAACQGAITPPTGITQDLDAAASDTTLLDTAGKDEALAAVSATSATPIKTGTVRAEPSLRIHTSPGTNTPVIYDAPNGTVLDIFAETAMGDSVWYQVRAQSTSFPQQLGWAYGGNIVVAGGDSTLSSDRPTTANPDQGYRDGYRSGYRDGENFKRYNSGYNPDAALQAGSGNPDPAYDQAFRRGFYAGFDAGYYGNAYNDNPSAGSGTSEPNTDNLSMACSDSFSNGSRFTVNYTREAGFNRFTLAPSGGAPASANLTYSGKTDAQHDVWKGTLSESEVRVDHLSSAAPKPGDEVYVTYNIFSSRAACR
jgi:hypothetical protein